MAASLAIKYACCPSPPLSARKRKRWVCLEVLNMCAWRKESRGCGWVGHGGGDDDKGMRARKQKKGVEEEECASLLSFGGVLCTLLDERTYFKWVGLHFA